MTNGIITKIGKNVMLNRGYKDTPDYNEPNLIAIGSGTTDAIETDTSLSEPLQLKGYIFVDFCISTTGWTSGGSGGALSLNSTTYKAFSNSLNLIKTGTASTNAYWYKTQSTTYDGTGKDLAIWLYIKDDAALNKLATTNALEIRFGSDASNYYYKAYNRADLSTGWNLLSFDIDSVSSIGSPSLTALDYCYIGFDTNNATDTISAGDIIMDLWHLIDTNVSDNYYIGFDSYTLDEANKKVTIIAYLNALQGIGYNISEFGEYNDDSTKKLIGKDVHNTYTKTDLEEIRYTWVNEIE